jgi:nucleoside-diphosphate-sugar epimerase
MKSVVIFGGCGFIGLYLAQEVVTKNLYEKVYLVDIKEPDNDFTKLIYQNILRSGKVDFIKKDVRENLNEIVINGKIVTILNLAAIHREPGHLEEEYFETNVNGAKNICSFADNYDCKNIIFTSSIAVYGSGEYEKNEIDDLNPSTPYGKSKLIAEKIHLDWQRTDKKNKIISICRPGVVFGAGEQGNVTRLIKIIKKRLFFYFGNKQLHKAAIYINELIRIIFWVNERQLSKKLEGNVLNNASFYPCPTIENFVNSISKNLNRNANFLSISKKLIKFILFIFSFILKNLSKNNSFNYMRLKKLFRSNNIRPNFLIENKYKFEFNLQTSFENWKKTYSKDWL